MYDLRIYTNSGYESLDIQPGSGLIVEANDPIEYSFGRSIKTYTVNILPSGRNNILLDNLWYKSFSKTITYDALLNTNNIEIIGKLIITNVSPSVAEGQFIAAIGTLWDNILTQDIRLDFDWSSWNHTLTETTISDSDAGNLFGGDVRYDFIYRGDGLQPSTPAGPLYNVDIAERLPAVRWRSLIEKIFGDHTIIQNVLSDDELDRLYVVHGEERLRNSRGWVRGAAAYNSRTIDKLFFEPSMNIGNTENTLSITDLFDPPYDENTYEDGRQYIFPETGSYRISGKFILDRAIFSSSIQTSTAWRLRRWTVEVRLYNSSDAWIGNVYTGHINLPDQATGPTEGLTFMDERVEIPYDTKTREFTAGQSIRILVHYRNVAYDGGNLIPFAPQVCNQIDIKADEGEGRIEPWDGPSWGTAVQGSWIVPQVSIGELIEPFLRMYNCEFYYSYESKTIWLWNRFVDPVGYTDITSAIIEGSVKSVERPIKENWDFLYVRDGADAWGQREFDVFGSDDGGIFVSGGSRSTRTITVGPFSYTAIRSRSPKVPVMAEFYVDETSPEYRTGVLERPQWKPNFAPRFMLYAGDLNWTYTLHYSGSSGGGQTTKSFVPRFLNSHGTNNLSFNGDLGLYERYHKGNIRRYREGIELTFRMILSSSALHDLYYNTGSDLRGAFRIGVPGYEGIYQIVKAELISGSIYDVRAIQMLEYQDVLLGDFSTDFSDDFNI
jgi:hypothetical protein